MCASVKTGPITGNQPSAFREVSCPSTGEQDDACRPGDRDQLNGEDSKYERKAVHQERQDRCTG